MQDYVATSEQIGTRLALMDAPNHEGLLVKMFVESFRDRLKSLFQTALSALRTTDDVRQQMKTFGLLEELALQEGRRLMRDTSHDKEFVLQPTKLNKDKGRRNSSGNGV